MGRANRRGRLRMCLYARRTGGLRFSTDFRTHKPNTASDTYPTEGVKKTLDWLPQKRVFAKFDLKNGFFQVALAEESRHLTEVRTVLGLLQYTRLAQGLKNSPVAFQRIVNLVLGDLKERSVCAFMDDGTFGTKTPDEYIESLDNAMSKMKTAGMKLKLLKRMFGVRTVEVLGHLVTPEVLLPPEGHARALKKLCEPAKVHSGYASLY